MLAGFFDKTECVGQAHVPNLASPRSGHWARDLYVDKMPGVWYNSLAMHTIVNPKNWKPLGVCSVDLTKIVLSNVGIVRSEPDYSRVFDHCAGLFGLLWDTPNKLIVRNRENIVEDGPAIYVANHVTKSDALLAAYTVYMHTKGRQLHVMMRDDYFGDKRWSKTALLDVDELAMSLGAIQVSREAGAYSQMKRFIRLLVEDGCFIIFPTGTRSKSGLVMELPPGLDELGKISFFASMAQRERFNKHGADRVSPVPMVPTGVSFDPTVKKTTLVFGEPVYLTSDPPSKKIHRTVLTEFDRQLVRGVSRLVEVNLAHLSALYLLHYAWHCGGQPDRNGHDIYLERKVIAGDLAEIVREVKEKGGLFLGDSLASELDPELRRVERLFAHRSVLKRTGEGILLSRDRVLSAPPVDREYRKLNPVKYFANQVAHLEEVVDAVETRVLKTIHTHR
jgi:1-acyl-sn-glycerol-3-phosphate acyltransferase